MALIIGTAGNDNNNYPGPGTLNGTINDDDIFGLTGEDLLLGYEGNDNLDGGGGNDYLNGYDGDDYLDGGDGNDGLLGGRGNDLLEGGSGNDYLDGQEGDDFMVGGVGNDEYYVDSIGDVVVEEANSGIDTISYSSFINVPFSYTLGANIENLIAGAPISEVRGNSLNNYLAGGDIAQLIAGEAGNDTLRGGLGDITGHDTLVGGTGNDVYQVYVSSYEVRYGGAEDTIIEAANEGIDTVQVTYATHYTLGANLENLEMVGTGAINGTGNSLNNRMTGNTNNDVLNGEAGNDTLIGADGNDLLNGGSGNDSMVGGVGNDTYRLDSAQDVVVEATNAGIDTVQSSIDFTLGGNLENLRLLPGATNGTGNTQNNSISGNGAANTLNGRDGNDTLSGGGGNDTLLGEIGSDLLNGGANDDLLIGGASADSMIGGSGRDSFRFNAPIDGIDTIVDFVAGEDSIQILASGFGGGLTAGVLNASQFQFGSSVAKDANDRFMYSAGGYLYYDPDGTGPIREGLIAFFSGIPSITNANIVIV
jgi:Ca2+-binding RTX toxin-like protein